VRIFFSIHDLKGCGDGLSM